MQVWALKEVTMYGLRHIFPHFPVHKQQTTCLWKSIWGWTVLLDTRWRLWSSGSILWNCARRWPSYDETTMTSSTNSFLFKNFYLNQSHNIVLSARDSQRWNSCGGLFYENPQRRPILITWKQSHQSFSLLLALLASFNSLMAWISFFSFMRLFWNHIFICLSVRHSMCDSSILRRLVRYRLNLNSFSSSNVW